MFKKGLITEVKKLSDMGYNRKTIAMQGLGYKEVLCYLRGEATLEETVDIIKRDTRRYAKRQITWFKRIEDIIWLDIDENTDFYNLVKNIKYHIATTGIIL
jgi:tRNA dimethylallyltransferase